MGGMRSSDVAEQAFSQVQASSAVQSTLGTPLEKGWIFTGSIETFNDTGNANISFSVSGPKGSATVHAEAHKDGGKWIFSTLTVKPNDGGKAIYLVRPPGEVI